MAENCLFTSQTRRKNYKFCLIYFQEDNSVAPMKTSAIINFDESYYQVGNNVTIKWPMGKNKILELPGVIMHLDSKSLFC